MLKKGVFFVFFNYRQEEEVSRTISLCSGMQSSTLAGLLATQFLGSSQAVPAACSVVAMAIMGLCLASFWGNGWQIRNLRYLIAPHPGASENNTWWINTRCRNAATCPEMGKYWWALDLVNFLSFKELPVFGCGWHEIVKYYTEKVYIAGKMSVGRDVKLGELLTSTC